MTEFKEGDKVLVPMEIRRQLEGVDDGEFF